MPEIHQHFQKSLRLSLNSWRLKSDLSVVLQSDMHLQLQALQGPYSWKILVLRVAPSNKILRKFLEMWVFPLKFKEKILVKKKVIQKAS